MGSRLALLAAAQLIAAAVPAGDAIADTRARELYKRGIEEYKAQKYEAAVATLKESYDLDPKPDALFALAQAERLGGRCPEARAHYKKLLEATTEIATAKAVQSNLDLCGPEPEKPAPRREPEKPAAPPPTPTPITKTVVREVRHTDKPATLLLAGGMLGLGAGGGLFLASRNSRDDADRALTLDDHNRLLDRADLQRIASFAAAGAGVALIGVAVVRWVIGGEAKSTEPKPGVTLAPSASGAMLVLSAGF
jgi:tetratricopeptide (TPR) repeat protein